MKKQHAHALSIAEAAEALGLSRATVARHVAAGRLRGVRLGRRVLIPAWVVDQLLAPPAAADPKARHGR